jgi:hypothetical protein
MLALLQLVPEEAAAVPMLTEFEAAYDGVKVITPVRHDEPWRAEIREGAVPGEGRHTSGFLVADPGRPAELLRKLEKLFAGCDPEDDTG